MNPIFSCLISGTDSIAYVFQNLLEHVLDLPAPSAANGAMAAWPSRGYSLLQTVVETIVYWYRNMPVFFDYVISQY